MAASSPIAVRTTTSVIVRELKPSRSCIKLTGVLFLSLEELIDLITNLSIGNLDIILGLTVIGHQAEKSIIGDVKLKIH
jgi:hypothetical protein